MQMRRKRMKIPWSLRKMTEGHPKYTPTKKDLSEMVWCVEKIKGHFYLYSYNKHQVPYGNPMVFNTREEAVAYTIGNNIEAKSTTGIDILHFTGRSFKNR
jgi:hypothetical protein